MDIARRTTSTLLASTLVVLFAVGMAAVTPIDGLETRFGSDGEPATTAPAIDVLERGSATRRLGGVADGSRRRRRCGRGHATPSPTADGTEQTEALDVPGDEDLEDPNDDIEDGVYRGSGVVLPVPDGWSLDEGAFAQGVIAALSEDGSQQMTARAVDTEEAEGEVASFDVETLVSGIRQQIPQEPDVDEEVEITGAVRAHRLTYLELPPQQEGGPTTRVTIVIAEDGGGVVGEFAFSALAESYDEEQAEQLVTQAGFDPDSDPPTLPQAPAGQATP